MEAALRPPLAQRINLRIVAFSLFVAVLVGGPLYIYLTEVVTGGIRQRGDVIEVNLKAMSTFGFDQVNGTTDDIPRKWRDLDGKRVQLVGEMWTGNNIYDEVNQFELVYSIAKCCFSGPPQIQHFVQSIASTESGTVKYHHMRPVRVTGVLHVGVERADGKVSSVYRLDVESVEPEA